VGVAVLGATLADFEARFGHLGPPANPSSGFVTFQSGTVSVGLDVVDAPAATYAERVLTITLGQGPMQPRIWDLALGRRICGALAPADARATGHVALTSDGGAWGIDDTYTSTWLADQFPSSGFVDAQGRVVAPGTFEIAYTYAANDDPMDLDSCRVAIGLSQTQA
jgi:hypothetical protein